MARGTLICVAMGLAAAQGVACSTLAGIEDLELTGSPDASADVATGSSSGGDGSRGDVTVDSPADVAQDGAVEASACSSGQTRCSGSAVETCTGGAWGAPVSCASGMCSSGACTGVCTVGQAECSGNGVQTCAGGTWGAPQPCANQTCSGGACTGVCAPGQTNPVPCGNCGTDTQTCDAGAWKSSGGCSGQGACAPGATQACNSHGMQTCTSSCGWGTCSCATAPVCTPGLAQCATATSVEDCDGCGQWQPPTTCTTGMCVGGVCTGACTSGQKECSGNSAQTCNGSDQWGTPVPCTSQTCVNGSCTGVCAPGQTNPVACGNCGSETQTCSGSGTWQSGTCSGQGACAPNATQTCNTLGSETCSPSCSWGSCSCPPSPVCTPGAKRCSGTSIQTCDPCGQWASATSCGAGMICSGSACVPAPTDCPGTFAICDGFENGTTIGSQWYVATAPGTTIVVDGTHPHLGSNALHIHYPGGGTQYVQTYIQNTSPTIFPLDTVYVRAWFSVSALTGVDDQTLIAVQSNANTSSGVGELGFQIPGGAIFDNVEDLASGNWGMASATATMPAAMPYGTYTCLELGIDASYNAPHPNGVEYTWQDVSSSASYVPDLLGTPAELQTLRGVLLGMQFQAPGNAFDLYIDDIAVDTSYIPCDQ